MTDRNTEMAEPVSHQTETGSNSPSEPSLSGRATRGAVWAVGANLVMRFASVAVTAILARLLSKEDFGVFAVALAVYLVVASVAELGMASAIARSAKEPDDIAPTIVSMSVMVSCGVGVAMAVLATPLATVLGQPQAAHPIRVLSLCLVLTGAFAVPGAQLVRDFRQDRIFLATVVGFLVANPILILLAVHGGGATAFAWSRVIGQAATGVVLVLSTSRRYRPGWRRNVVGPLLRFGLPLSVANVVNWSLLNADYLILGRLVDAAAVGSYMIAFNVANWSTALMGSVLNSVVVPAFGRMSTDRRRLGASLVSATEIVALLALPIAAMTLALSGPLVLVLFGQKWNESSPVLAVLAWYGLLYSFSLLFANVLVAIGRTMWLLAVQAVWVAALIPSIIVGLHYWGLPGVAWAHVVTISLIAVPAYLIAALHATGLPLRRLLRPLSRPALAAALAGGGAWLTSRAFETQWVSLIVGGLLGAAIYAAVLGPSALRRLPDRFVPRSLARRRRDASSDHSEVPDTVTAPAADGLHDHGHGVPPSPLVKRGSADR